MLLRIRNRGEKEQLVQRTITNLSKKLDNIADMLKSCEKDCIWSWLQIFSSIYNICKGCETSLKNDKLAREFRREIERSKRKFAERLALAYSESMRDSLLKKVNKMYEEIYESLSKDNFSLVKVKARVCEHSYLLI